MTEGSDHPIEFLASFADLDDPAPAGQGALSAGGNPAVVFCAP